MGAVSDGRRTYVNRVQLTTSYVIGFVPFSGSWCIYITFNGVVGRMELLQGVWPFELACIVEDGCMKSMLVMV